MLDIFEHVKNLPRKENSYERLPTDRYVQRETFFVEQGQYITLYSATLDDADRNSWMKDGTRIMG